MKKLILIPLITALLIPFNVISAAEKLQELQIVCSPGFSNLCRDIVNNYQKVNHDIKITVLNEENIRGGEENHGTLFITDEHPGEWKTVIGRNITVPFINSSNPFIAAINKKGISSGNFIKADPDWSDLTGSGTAGKVTIFVAVQPGVENDARKFIRNDNIILNILPDAAAVELAVKANPLSIGFCLYTDMIKDNTLPSGISFLPIDKNENGNLDPFENIYRTPEALLRGVWTGKYPSELCNNIYISASEQPSDPAVISFLSWVLTSGQDYISQEGFCALGINERNARLELITAGNREIHPIAASGNFTWIIISSILALLAILVITAAYRKREKVTTGTMLSAETGHLTENSVIVPKGIMYDKSHTWAFMERDGVVRIGIDDFLHRVTGTLTRISFRYKGERVLKGEKIMTLIQDGKHLDIVSPVSGIIRSYNNKLATRAYLVNDSPFDEGWIYTIEPDNWSSESSLLLMADRYTEWLKKEFSRLKDFLAASIASKNNEYAHIILQDGGELRQNLLKEMGPDVWEDFQNKFIDTSI